MFPPLDRKLLAILAADVVGNSKLMEADEAGTIARLKTVRTVLAGSAQLRRQCWWQFWRAPWHGGSCSPATLSAKPSVAVLPFNNYSGDEATGRLADGLTECGSLASQPAQNPKHWRGLPNQCACQNAKEGKRTPPAGPRTVRSGHLWTSLIGHVYAERSSAFG